MRASALSVATLGLFVLGFIAAPGCGSSDEKPAPAKKTDEPGQPIDCQGLTCNAVKLVSPYPPIEACCTDDGKCGLDGSQFEQYGAMFTEKCQARDQPGVLDSHCPDTMPVDTTLGPLSFKGCCTASNRCGYMVDTAFTLIQLGLGCVDAAPFLEGGTPKDCGMGAGGAGGGGGQ